MINANVLQLGMLEAEARVAAQKLKLSKIRHDWSHDGLDRTLVTLTIIGDKNDPAAERAKRLLAQAPTEKQTRKREAQAVRDRNAKLRRYARGRRVDHAGAPEGDGGSSPRERSSTEGAGGGARDTDAHHEGQLAEAGEEAAADEDAAGAWEHRSTAGDGANAATEGDADSCQGSVTSADSDGTDTAPPRFEQKLRHEHRELELVPDNRPMHLLEKHPPPCISLLQQGLVTCTVLRMKWSDRSGQYYPRSWYGYWSFVINPVFFGKETTRIVTKREKKLRPPKPPKPPPVPRDPESRVAAAEAELKRLTKRGFHLGVDGIEHPTPEQHHAAFEMQRAKLHLQLTDAENRRIAKRTAEDTAPPWFHREKVQPRVWTQEEISKMMNVGEEERIQVRVERNKRAEEAKAQRKIDSIRRERRMKMVGWTYRKLISISPYAKQLGQAMKAEMQQEKVQLDRWAYKKEVTPADMARFNAAKSAKIQVARQEEAALETMFEAIHDHFTSTAGKLPTGADFVKRRDRQRSGATGSDPSADYAATMAGQQLQRAVESAAPQHAEKPKHEFIQGIPQKALEAASPREAALTGHPLLLKKAIYHLIGQKNSAWFEKADKLRALKPVLDRNDFAVCFFLHPISGPKGHVSKDEFVDFGMAVLECHDRYERVLAAFDKARKQREIEAHKFKLRAEKRAKEAERASEALENNLMAKEDHKPKVDPHKAHDAWCKFHVHVIVQPLARAPAYCCVCRRNFWERVRSDRVEIEQAHRDMVPHQISARLIELSDVIAKRVEVKKRLEAERIEENFRRKEVGTLLADMVSAVETRAFRTAIRVSMAKFKFLRKKTDSQVAAVMAEMLYEVEKRHQHETCAKMLKLGSTLAKFQATGLPLDAVEKAQERGVEIVDDSRSVTQLQDLLKKAHLTVEISRDVRTAKGDELLAAITDATQPVAVKTIGNDSGFWIRPPAGEVTYALVPPKHDDAAAADDDNKTPQGAAALKMAALAAAGASASAPPRPHEHLEPGANSKDRGVTLDPTRHSASVIEKHKAQMDQHARLARIRAAQLEKERNNVGDVTFAVNVCRRAQHGMPLAWRITVSRASGLPLVATHHCTIRWNQHDVQRSTAPVQTTDPVFGPGAPVKSADSDESRPSTAAAEPPPRGRQGGDTSKPKATKINASGAAAPQAFECVVELEAPPAAMPKGLAKLRKVGKGVQQVLVLERDAEEHNLEAIDKETKLQREELEREEEERQSMYRAEEWTLRFEEVVRRRLERKHQLYQEKGMKLFHQTLASVVRISPSLRRLQWIKAWHHTAADEPLTAQVRDATDGKFNLCRLLPCRYREDANFVIQQINEIDDVRHKNVARIRHASIYSHTWSDPHTGYTAAQGYLAAVVMQFCGGGQVLVRCTNTNTGVVSNEQMVRWAADVANGLRAMHHEGVTHRNLNPANVHLDEHDRAVITGFMCVKIPRGPNCHFSQGRADCGSPNIIAPEVEDGYDVTPAADVWAFGCCLYAWMASVRQLPIGFMRSTSIEALLKRVPVRFGPKLRAVLRMCLQHHPTKRASADDVFKRLLSSRG